MNKVYVLTGHYLNKTTIVIGDHCVNGCQTFTSSEAKMIFDSFKVGPEYRKDVMDLFKKYNPKVGFDLSDIKETFLSQKIVDILVNFYRTLDLIGSILKNNNLYMVTSCFKYCSKSQLDQFVKHPNNRVRMALASIGHKDHLDEFVKDPSPDVRCIVATHQHKEHLNILVEDKSDVVKGYATVFWH